LAESMSGKNGDNAFIVLPSSNLLRLNYIVKNFFDSILSNSSNS
jgi:hypothetical protein